MPSRGKAVRTMVSALETIDTDGSGITVLEAGSGWGTVVLTAARQLKRGRFIGCELSPLPFLFSKLAAAVSESRERIRFVRSSFLTADLRDIRVVLCYLHPQGMARLKRKIEEEARGTIYIVSNTFQFSEWTPAAVFPVYDMYKSNVYVYKLIYA